eukprot:9416876-Ditylum_brightwellii.AAC.1
MKENILETIVNWLLLFNHNFVVGASAPPLLYDVAADHRHEQVYQHPSPDQESTGRKTFGP